MATFWIKSDKEALENADLRQVLTEILTNLSLWLTVHSVTGSPVNVGKQHDPITTKKQKRAQFKWTFAFSTVATIFVGKKQRKKR